LGGFDGFVGCVGGQATQEECQENGFNHESY
jgi:hypothetical protein